MDTTQLWTPLNPIEENKEVIRQDLERGLAPNLPYFIVGLNDVKKALSAAISTIDSHFSYALAWGQYGNGKSNLMKYLKYFFQQHPECNTKVAIWRADVDRYDIITFLLYIIQNEYSSDLLASLKSVVADGKMLDLCDNFSGSFAAIKSFAEKFGEKKDSDEDLQTLISLGTGKLYDSNSFKKFELTKLTDYNRREVLVFFLNALAYANHYVIFCIDELEKIQEKSRARFQNLLTTFRELIDLSSSIKGHMLLAAVTESVSGNHSFESYNPAFERRIKNYKLELKAIDKADEIKTMAEELVRVLGDEYQLDSYEDIANEVYKNKRKYPHTSDVVRALFAQLSKQADKKTWKELLEEAKMAEAFFQKHQSLEDSGILLRINQKLFAPLKDYLNIISNTENDYEVKGQMLQSVYSSVTNRCYVFLFTDDINANINRLKNVIKEYPKAELFVFKPKELDINMDTLKNEGLEQVKDLIPYDPIDLMALLELYMDNYDNDALREVVTLYTHQL
jgi:hypothetical protein